MSIKYKISEVLNMIKGFEVGYTSKSKDRIIIDNEGKRYVVSFQEIENPNDDMLEDIDIYL